MKHMFISLLFDFFIETLAEAVSRTSNTVDDEIVQVLENNADQLLEIMEQKFL